MSRFKNKVDAQQAHIFSLRLALGLLALLSTGLWFGWQAAPRELTVHVPPDLRAGSVRKWWDIPPENIYGFALYIFGQLNRWPVDGEKDYLVAIHQLQAYLTPSCKAFFEGDYQYRAPAGELRQRVRGVYETLGRGYSDDPELRVRQRNPRHRRCGARGIPSMQSAAGPTVASTFRCSGPNPSSRGFWPIAGSRSTRPDRPEGIFARASAAR